MSPLTTSSEMGTSRVEVSRLVAVTVISSITREGAVGDGVRIASVNSQLEMTGILQQQPELDGETAC